MTAEIKIPIPVGELTWDDLQVIPDELHHHYELIEGQILMSPSPSFRHQRCVGRLFARLLAAASDEVEVLVSPFDFAPEASTVLQPDVLVIRRGTQEDQRTVVPPVIVIEVLSPSSRTTDRTTKRELYARFGIQHYWIVDPDEPSIRALTLGPDGAYREDAAIAGTDIFAVSQPVTVQFAPSDLVAD